MAAWCKRIILQILLLYTLRCTNPNKHYLALGRHPGKHCIVSLDLTRRIDFVRLDGWRLKGLQGFIVRLDRWCLKGFCFILFYHMTRTRIFIPLYWSKEFIGVWESLSWVRWLPALKNPQVSGWSIYPRSSGIKVSSPLRRQVTRYVTNGQRMEALQTLQTTSSAPHISSLLSKLHVWTIMTLLLLHQ